MKKPTRNQRCHKYKRGLCMTKFKVGDLVVYRDLPHERLFSIRYVSDDEIVVYELWDEMGAKTFTEFYPFPDIRHATPKEIKAGIRLPL